MMREFWEKNAEAWTKVLQSRQIESRKITNPAIIDEILRLQPRALLDLGCGEGWISSQVLPNNVDYLGLDFSAALIDTAKRAYPEASFEVVGYDELVSGKWKSPRAFDLVVFNFSLFEENLRPILRSAAALIQPKGKVLVQTLHPCFALQPYQDGRRTEDFKTFPVPFEGTMPWFGRTLGTWVREFSESGLKIRAMSEPVNPETRIPASVIFILEIGSAE